MYAEKDNVIKSYFEIKKKNLITGYEKKSNV